MLKDAELEYIYRFRGLSFVTVALLTFAGNSEFVKLLF